jgi:D-alanyl-D-alanine carboxypeptidase
MLGQRYLTNHNKLLWRVDGADGVKTGFTKAAGRILVSSAVRNDRRLVAVTLDAPDDWNDHRALLEEGFSRYTETRIVSKGQFVDSLEVAGGENQRVSVLAAEDFSYALAPEERPQLMLPGPGFVYAPAVEGADAGIAYVLLEGRAIGKVPVVYGQTIEQIPEEKKSFWEKLRN